MDLRQEKQLMKKLRGLYTLQFMSLLFIIYGLFFFYKDIEDTQSPSENPVFEVVSTNTSHTTPKEKEKKEDKWFNKQYERIFIFFDKSNEHKPDYYRNQLNFTCDQSEDYKNFECEREIDINVEPLCVEEQKITSIMTGNYPYILDHLYTHTYLSKDSVINQMQLKGIKSALFGNSQNWEEIFPTYFNSENTYKSEQILDIIEHSDFNDIKFGIGEYVEKEELLQDFQDMIDNLGHNKKALILLYEEQECSVFQDRTNKLTAYSTVGFQNYLSQQEIGEPFPKQIDFASSLSILLGLPLPFDNYGSPIVDLYSQNLKHQVTFKNKRLTYLHSISYHFLMTYDSTVEYLSELNYRYSFYFIQNRVNQLIQNQQDFFEKLQELEDMIFAFDDKFTNTQIDIDGEISQEQLDSIPQNQQEEFHKIKNELIEYIRLVHQKISEVRLVIEHNNFGPMYVMIFGFFGFFFTFFVFALLMTKYQSIFGFIRNTMSFVFNFTNLFSMNFFNFIISSIATFLFVVGGVYSRLQFQIEGEIIIDALIIFSILQVIISLCDSEIQEKRKCMSIILICISVAILYTYRFLKDDQQQMIFSILGSVILGIGFFLIITKIEEISKEDERQQRRSCVYNIMLCINIVISEVFYAKSFEQYYIYIKYIILTIFLFNIGFYVKMLRKGRIEKISNIANIIMIFITFAPLLAIISRRSQIYFKFILFLCSTFSYIGFQIVKKEQRSYQSIIFLMLFMTVFQDAILHTRELHSLDFQIPQQNIFYILIQIFMNIIQISTAQICTAFLLPIWVKIINIKIINISDIINSKEEKYLKLSRFGSIFIICTLYTLRICIYILTLIARNLNSQTKYAQFRILKEGFIFESVSYLVFFFFLVLICNFSRYFQASYRNLDTDKVQNFSLDYQQNSQEEYDEDEEEQKVNHEINTEMGHLTSSRQKFKQYDIDQL